MPKHQNEIAAREAKVEKDAKTVTEKTDKKEAAEIEKKGAEEPESWTNPEKTASAENSMNSTKILTTFTTPRPQLMII